MEAIERSAHDPSVVEEIFEKTHRLGADDGLGQSPGEPPALAPMRRTAQMLNDIYEQGRKKLKILLPLLPALPRQARVRLGRVRGQFASFGIAEIGASVQTVVNFMVAATVAVTIVGGSFFGAFANAAYMQLVSARQQVSGQTVSQDGRSVSSGSATPVAPPGPSAVSVEVGVSTSAVPANAPAALKTDTRLRQITIEHNYRVDAAGHSAGTSGSTTIVDCDPPPSPVCDAIDNALPIPIWGTYQP